MILGDTMGEMFVYYGACDIAFIGGSLLPYGGQNLIEANAVGVPVVIGPHTYNFSDITEQAIEFGAALRVVDSTELAQKVNNLLQNPQLRAKMSESALEFSQAHRGATERLVKLLAPYLSS